MKRIPIYEYKSQTARNLKDLTGVIQDLRLTSEYLKLIHKGDQDDTIEKALFTASLITYRRCFTHGARAKLTHDDVAKLIDGAGEFHKYILAQSDKFAAHSVNPFEQIKIGVAVHEKEVSSIATFGFKLSAFSQEDFESWGRLLSTMIKSLIKTAKATEDTLLQEARKRPISQIVRAGEMRIYAPPASDTVNTRDV